MFIAASLSFVSNRQSAPFNSGYCNHLVDVASNLEKIEYIYEWVNSRGTSQELLAELGPNERIWQIDSLEGEFDILEIDWEHLDLVKEYGRYGVHRSPQEDLGSSNPNHIKSVSIGQGRNSINVKVLGSSTYGLEELDNENSKTTYHINENVAVLCHF